MNQAEDRISGLKGKGEDLDQISKEQEHFTNKQERNTQEIEHHEQPDL